jgi:hypothetical protein
VDNQDSKLKAGMKIMEEGQQTMTWAGDRAVHGRQKQGVKRIHAWVCEEDNAADGGNIFHAAKLAGMSRVALQKILRRLELTLKISGLSDEGDVLINRFPSKQRLRISIIFQRPL